jgi:hypothetical protein
VVAGMLQDSLVLGFRVGISLGREESGSCFRTKAHLSDDETVAKMGHPDLWWVISGPPANLPYVMALTDRVPEV